jgi:hypothetical protein
VSALASDDTERRLAGAVLLRRFFDRSSELGVRDLLGRRRTPYAEEALSVIAAVLRGLPSFTGAKLHGASFAGARNVPAGLEPLILGPKRLYSSVAGAPEPAPGPAVRRSVFLSLPSLRTPLQEAVCDRLVTLLRREGLGADCAGAVVFGRTHLLDLEDAWDDHAILQAMGPWLAELEGS